MSLNDHLKHVLPLLNGSLSVCQLAEMGCLPSYLNDDSLAQLRFPKSEIQQGAFKKVLRAEMRNGNLKTLTIEEFVDLVMGEKEKLTPEKYREPKPQLPRPPNTIVVELPAITGAAVATSDSDIIPGNEHKERNKRRIYVVHRDDFKKWLIKEGEWPLSKENLLSRWWPESKSHNIPDISFASDDSSDVVEKIFRLEQDYWRVTFRGQNYTIKQSIGMQYITHLIERSYNDEPDIHVSDLYYLVHKRPAAEETYLTNMTREQMSELGLNLSDFKEGLDVLTPEGKKWAAQKDSELNEQIIDAQERGDTKEALRLRETKEALKDYVKKALGFGGRHRTYADPNDRMRKSIQKAIRYVLDKLGIKDDTPNEFAVYLKNHITTAFICSFRKDPNISWRIMKK